MVSADNDNRDRASGRSDAFVIPFSILLDAAEMFPYKREGKEGGEILTKNMADELRWFFWVFSFRVGDFQMWRYGRFKNLLRQWRWVLFLPEPTENTRRLAARC